jgi:hypothetical protein
MVTTSNKPFLALTAADLMSREVITVPQEMSLRAAAHRLAQAAITGAPVVDGCGRCVGVLSATDFMHWAEQEGSRAPQPSRAAPVCSDWQVVDFEELPTIEVRQYMTPDPVTVPPATGIGELARRMLDAHIHRVIVVDREGRPVGVVSSTDILAAVAYAEQNFA